MGDDHTSVGNGIPFKSGPQQDTTGIRIWHEVFYVPQKEGEKMAVLLMDTQGLFDNATPEDVNISLLTLSTLASSLQIFNTIRMLDTRDLSYLKTCVEFAKETARSDDPLFKLQALNFLVRDHDGDEPFKYGEEGGEKYMQTIFDSKDGDDKQITIRKQIKESFNNVSCSLLPHPGLGVPKKAFQGTNAELEPEFRQQIKSFVEFIAFPFRLQRKESNKKALTARDILNMIIASDGIFACRVYEPENMIEVNIKSYYATAYEESIIEYDEAMKKIFPGDNVMNDEELKKYHQDAKKNALKVFELTKQMGDGKFRKHYHAHLGKICEDHFDTATRKNNALKNAAQLVKKRKTRKAICEYEKEMQLFLANDCVEPIELMKHHTRTFEKVRNGYGDAINADELQSEVNDLHLKIRFENKQRIDMKKSQSEDVRKSHLYWLVRDLDFKCGKKWRKRLSTYQAVADMAKHHKEIKKKIEIKYRKNALTDIELKYSNKLEHRLEVEYKRALAASRKTTYSESLKEQISRRPIKNEEEKKDIPEKEHFCYDVVEKIICKYAEELQKNLDNKITPQQMRDNMESEHRDKLEEYYEGCFIALKEYFDKLKEMIKERKEKANKQNNKTKENMISELNRKLEEEVIVEEERLQRMMNDRYFDMDELESHYEKIKRSFLDVLSSSATQFFLRSHIIKEFESVIKEKFDESLEKMKKKMLRTLIVEL
ncbi:uncharacterized protein LOC120326332 isoform X1 [Styela clava]